MSWRSARPNRKKRKLNDRTCVGCRRTGEPSAWVRIAANRTGGLAIGREAPGRGAWVCSKECFEQALRRGALARALRRTVTNTDAQALRARLNNKVF